MGSAPERPSALRQNRGLLISGGILVAAVALFVWGPRLFPKSDTIAQPSPLPSPILATRVSDVQKVVVKSGGKSLTLTRVATGWTYAACADGAADCPTQAADLAATTQILGAILGLRPTTTIAVPDALANYGLDNPGGGEIDITATTGTAILLVGLKAPDQASFYLRVKDRGTVYVVPANLQTDILARVDSPPVPVPTPSPAPPPPAAPSPSPSVPIGPPAATP